MSRAITGASLVAGVAGAPVAHSLSPLIHNAWLAAAGIDGVYVAFTPPALALCVVALPAATATPASASISATTATRRTDARFRVTSERASY